MGGRGSTFGTAVIRVLGNGGSSPVRRIHVIADMMPQDRVKVNAETTLRFLEGRKQSYDKEQLQILDAHGYVTTAYQGDKHSVGIDAHGLEQMRGNIVTHNHPDVFGGTFSDADIACLQYGMSELRASAREGNYSMRATKQADPHSFFKAYTRAAPRLQEKMRTIAMEIGQRRYANIEAYTRENRRAQLRVLHDWYTENAGTYGYIYTFDPRED